MSKGKIFEADYSLRLPQDQITILISAKVMRSRGAGQVDLATYDPKAKNLTLYELKSSNRMSFKQYRRLRSSALLLGVWLNCSAQIKVISNKS